METPVLVAYATKYGATAEIAERIGQVLREADLRVDVLPAAHVTDLSSYGAVVLGSAVYLFRWRGEAARLLNANEKILSERPVWLFSSGPTSKGDPVAFPEGRLLPTGLQPVADRIRPRDIAVFHGVANLDRMNWLERWMFRRASDAIGDFRDWDGITSWASTIAGTLRQSGAAPEMPPDLP